MKLYRRNPGLNGCYKDGQYAKDRGAAITTNPHSITTDFESHFAWIDGWNKSAIESTPQRFLATFSTTTTATAPATGGIAFNNAVLASVTIVKLALLQLTGVTLNPTMADLPVGTSIRIINPADETNFAVYVTVSQVITTYEAITVTFGSSAGALFVDASSVVVAITRP